MPPRGSGIDANAALDAPRRGRRLHRRGRRSVGPVPCGASLPGSARAASSPFWRKDRVYFVGHPVAVVVATDRYIARDAADLVEVDYEASCQRSPIPKRRSRPARRPSIRSGPTTSLSPITRKAAMSNQAFAEAEVIVKQRITSQRLIPTAMETRGVVAEWQPPETKHSRCIPRRRFLTCCARCWRRMLGLRRESAARDRARSGRRLRQQAERLRRRGADGLRVHEDRQAGEVDRIPARELSCAPFTAAATWTTTRSPPRATAPSWALKLKLIQDLGAYHQLLTPAIPTLSVLMMPGLYRFQNILADIVGAFTNCVPTDAYRGAGRPEATHGIERMVDMLAAELKMDPAEIRLKNFIRDRRVSLRHRDRTCPTTAATMRRL